MEAKYFFEHDGVQSGPVTLEQLHECAAKGALAAGDDVWEEGSAQKRRADSVAGLFPEAAGGAFRPDARTAREKATRLYETGMARARHYVARGSKATSLDPFTFTAVNVGLAALLIVLVATMFTWYSYYTSSNVFGTAIEEGEAYRGISYGEGKLAFLLVIVAWVWIGVGLFEKSWLKSGCVAGGAISTFLLVSLYSVHSRLASVFDAAIGELEDVKKMMSGGIMGQTMNEMEKAGMSMIPKVSGGVGWSLGLAVLMAAGAAVAFLLACLRHPVVLPIFQKPNYPAAVQKHGVVGAAYALALLCGIVFAVFRY